jgi:CRP-like cAMP-binding protein
MDATMIVVGNRRVQGAKRLLGSIASDVLHHASCDVLVAHTAADPSAVTDHGVSTATLFAGCSAEERRQIDALATSIKVKEGHVLTSEGKTGKEFGVLLNGTATVTIGGETVATLEAGDHFGEMALLGPTSAQSGTVTADEDLEIAVMSVQEFRTLAIDFPSIEAELRRVADARRAANDPS